MVWGTVYLTSGIGLLARKFWALRLAQVSFILFLVLSPLIFIGIPDASFKARIITLIIFDTVAVLLLWYLSRRHTVEQFVETSVAETSVQEKEPKEISEQRDISESQESFKEKCSLRPIFTTIGFILWYGSQIILFIAMVSYFFEWWGNWAFLLIIGGLIGIPFISFIFSIMTFAPIFPIVYWLYTGTFPLWYFGIWGISIMAMITVSLLTKEDSY